MTVPLDPVAAWHRLHPKVQEQLGAAAIALGIGDHGVATAEEVQPWDAASTEAGLLIDELTLQHVLVRQCLPDSIDLAPLGIQQCRACGCTDNHASELGCEWVEPGLCSRCAGGVELPPGKTCGDCQHIRRCKAIFGHIESDTYCDWAPSRFRELANAR